MNLPNKKRLFHKASILFIWTILCLYFTKKGFATHNRAGEIVYELLSPLTYRATINTYTQITSIDADRDFLELKWGDGSRDTLRRFNGPDISRPGGGLPNGIPDGEPIGNGIKVNRYTAVHTYNGARPFYIISMQDPNRTEEACSNIPNSVGVPFYIEDTIFFQDPSIFGFNRGPQLLAPPIDIANANDTFRHSPNAFDLDGDSLHFSLVVPLQNQGVPVPNYLFPQEIIPGPNNTFEIDPNTGLITWAVPPQCPCVYNIAIQITEFREGVKLSTILRDLQILVRCQNNDPPIISELRDTCIVAGENLSISVRGSDINRGQFVTLSATGGPFAVAESVATFTQNTGNPALGTFNWQTTCSHIRSSFYNVVFKAEDNFRTNGVLSPLSDIKSWKIRVVPPAPQSLSAQVGLNYVDLNWDSLYTCANFENFRGFCLWRRIGENNFDPHPCDSDLSSKGYERIAQNVNTYNYRDTTIRRGINYCYRVTAHFANQSPNGTLFNRVESIPSNEICAELARNTPLITHASVQQTSSDNGHIYVSWNHPLTSPGNLDTNLFVGPYRYEILRFEGLNNNDFTRIGTIQSPSFAALKDSIWLDSNMLNTSSNPYTYRIDFYANNILVGSSDPASSPFLVINTGDGKLGLNLNVNVPWINQSYRIFRQAPNENNFVQIATTQHLPFQDTGLINGETYCYYIETIGHYILNNTQRQDTLFNLSQQTCATPIDMTPPCPPPGLSVRNDCETDVEQMWTTENFVNQLSWSIPRSMCASDLAKYYVYFARSSNEFIRIDSILSRKDTTFKHKLNTSLAGCYYITAIDSTGNESIGSDTICIDNCPLYNLPNAFTPNGDGFNDLYTPILPFRFIPKIDITIQNRWGNVVFQTNDPMINWDGKDQNTGKDLPNGTYIYTGYMYEDRLNGMIRKPLPPKMGGGVILMIRK